MDIEVNVTNPAEFFASLGTLELTGGRSSFTGDGNVVTFAVTTDKELPDLKTLPVTSHPFDDAGTAPVTVGDLRLDWWLDVFRGEACGLKLWAGTCCPLNMLRNYQKLMPTVQLPVHDLLGFNVRTKTKSTFNLDTRASRNPLGAGFSEKEAGESSRVFPYAEFLCAVGLQNFSTRPSSLRFDYRTWGRAIPLSIAHGAVRQDVPGLGSRLFEVTLDFVSNGMKEVSQVVCV